MDATTPAVSPLPVEAWYKSQIMQRAALAIVVHVIGLSPLAKYVIGVDWAPVVNQCLEAIGLGLDTFILHARATQVVIPPVALTKSGAEMRNMLRFHASMLASIPSTAGGRQCAVAQYSEVNAMNIPTLANIPLDLLVGALIAQGTGGDKTKQAARAAAGLKLVAGFQQILNGDVAEGINALTAAVQSNVTLSPAESLAFQNLISLGGNLTSIGAAEVGSTLLGQVDAVLVGKALAEVTRVCNAYLPPSPTPPPSV